MNDDDTGGDARSQTQSAAIRATAWTALDIAKAAIASTAILRSGCLWPIGGLGAMRPTTQVCPSPLPQVLDEDYWPEA